MSKDSQKLSLDVNYFHRLFMFFQALINTIFIFLVIVFIPLESFSEEHSLRGEGVKEGSVTTKSKEDVKEEKDVTVKSREEKISKILDEISKGIDKKLLESPWFKSDNGMSDYFIGHVYSEVLNPVKEQIKLLSDSQLESFNFKIIESMQVFEEELMSFIFKSQKQFPHFIFKKTKLKEGESPYHIAEPIGYAVSKERIPEIIEHFDQIIKEFNPKEVGINMYHNFSMEVMIALSQYFRDKKMNINVVGFCNHLCASYFLLEFEKISIGPYGLVSYGGSSESFYNEFLQVFKNNEEQHQKTLKEVGGLENFMLKSFNDVENRELLKDLIFNNEEYRYILLKIRNVLMDSRKESIDSYVSSEVVSQVLKENKEVLYQLSIDLSDFLASDSKSRSAKSRKNKRQEYMLNLSHFAMMEKKFFESYTGKVKSNLNYSIFEFLNFVSSISQFPPPSINYFYLNYERKYESPEITQPSFIVPSTSLLKQLGLNVVQGVNNTSKLKLEENMASNFLNLDESQIEKCGFFKKESDFSSTKQCYMDLLNNR